MISPVNVFTPATEVQDINRFAGRQTELRSLAQALESEGVQIVIYGNRGVGKSSIARLLGLMANGNADVLARADYQPTETFEFVTVHVTCDDSITSIPRLLLRLLTDDDALAPWVPFKVVQKEGAQELGAGLNVKVISLSGKATESITQASQELESDIVSVFGNALAAIRQSGVAKHGILIIIDEFDRIRDRSGLASLMRAYGPSGVTFAIVGVATTVQDLITEHESVARQLSDGTIPVPQMSDDEMNEIFDRAEALLEQSVTFATQTRAWIIGVARGHPYYVHLLGKHSLLRAIEEKSTVVTQSMAEDAMRQIALKGSAPIQETLYKTAIGHSFVRESILKSFAACLEDEIHTTELYSGIARDLGIAREAISVYVGQLASLKYGAVLVKTRDRYYRFTDTLFKAYAAARPFQLKAGDEEDGA